MYARRPEGAGRRRGVVLILILAMLGLLALIGVTFATFSGQAQIGARHAAEAVHTPPPEQVIDFALDQLINDTGNPASALRGHSLKRDMYGLDFYTDTTVVAAGVTTPFQNWYLNRIPEPIGQPLIITGAKQIASAGGPISYQVTTNIPTNSNRDPVYGIQNVPQLYNANFTGCVLRLQQWIVDSSTLAPIRPITGPDKLTQTFEIVADDRTSGNSHVFQLTVADRSTTATTSTGAPSTTLAFVQPDTATNASIKNLFEIDGRYMRAFNGLGLDRVIASDDFGNARPFSAYPNFLYNRLNAANYPSGYNDPNSMAYQMDEDFDAVDNDNWFLALRTADGQVTIPSFHRPGNLILNPSDATQNDWKSKTAASRSKFLRVRKIDHPQSGDTFADLLPDAITGKITKQTSPPTPGFDVDNDGDGVSDSVWIDLGYPVQRDSTGKLFKPLFAFMILGLNGRLPLNTAGNLNARALDGSVLAAPDHASHIGYSVNEINPEYALSAGQVGPAGGAGELRHLLQGNPGNPSATPPIPPTEGRFGEVDIIRASGGAAFPRAGRSYLPNQTYSATVFPKVDAFDSDFTGTDFFPAYKYDTMSSTYTSHPEVGDKLDAANRVLLPSERYRRFVSPIDLAGIGRLMHFDNIPAGPLDWGLGSDIRGRSSPYLYFRPPGISNWPGDLPDPADATKTLANNALNIYHGYESFRNPPGNWRNLMAPAPYDMNAGMKLPTFSNLVNSNSPADYAVGSAINGIYVGGGLGLQEAAQMNVYDKTAYDANFGVSDQEYIDRKGDVDAAILSTRLRNLVPALDINATMRNMFATDSWEIGTSAAPTATMGSTFGFPRANTALSDGSLPKFEGVANLPSLMHGGRRINLNLPLPVSDDPYEPVRQKFCRDVYQMMKSVLYPPDGMTMLDSTGTRVPVPAETLAAIGQYAVNICDFRDPDGTMTAFSNYDLVLTDIQTASVPSTLAGFQSTTTTIKLPAGVAKFSGAGANGTPLVQWGMEYNPIAITEIVGYQYIRKDPASKADMTTPRLFIELVNTLSKDYGTGGSGTASDLDLNGWGFVITQDNPASTDETTSLIERPNRITGQLRQSTINTHFVPLYIDPATSKPAGLPKPVPAMNSTGGQPEDYYIFGNYINNTAPTTITAGPPKVVGYPQVELNTPPIDAQLSDTLVNQITETALTPATMATLADNKRSQFYWLHLLRPVNAKDPTSQKVVVDSFRFPYFVDNGIAKAKDANNDTVTQGTNAIYSTRRLQPYRGGHFVPYSETLTNAPNPYGYSEQTFPTQAQTPPASADATKAQPLTAVYGMNVQGTITPTQISGNIYHTIDRTNSNGENWDIFPFHDRDFQSVAELLLVPACPPGLFTKQFVEYPGVPAPIAPQTPAPMAFGVNTGATPPTARGILPPTAAQLARAGADNMMYYYPPPWKATNPIGPSGDALTIPAVTLPLTGYSRPSAAPTANPIPDPPQPQGVPPTASQFTMSGVGAPNDAPMQPNPNINMPDPAAFPYLPEAFFYSSGVKNGWYKALEFFEVPSTSFGYIGPVAAGQNADWARRDLRPGLLNLNLIFDEEIFFALMDDLRLNGAAVGAGGANYLGSPTYDSTLPAGVKGLPHVATAILPNGAPSYSYPMPNRGYNNGTTAGMKAAFSDFLKLRDGGSGVVFSPMSTSPFNQIWGYPDPWTKNYAAMPSRPFRSLANQYFGVSTDFNIDINDTVMRPARLPAYQLNTMTADPKVDLKHADQARRFDLITNPLYDSTAMNPQVKFLAATPRIAPRALFQIPDADFSTVSTNFANAGFIDPTKYSNTTWSPATQVVSPIFDPTAQAAVAASAADTTITPVPPPTMGWTDADGIFLTKQNSSLFSNTSYQVPPVPPATTSGPPVQGYLGGSTYQGVATDHRAHPAYRTEMLSKVMNQTTVRTHQYAVWLTVGFFEVVKEGNKQMYNQYDPVTGSSMAMDQLGRELNADAGKNIRYRSYFLLDRTRATGFNPQEPGDYRDLIVFRRRIE
ncbi:MAG: hypothetical protein JWN86_685 [Planctomycetota bacterium]|nr:hypothetical protein [Planctomycetota bacterium]